MLRHPLFQIVLARLREFSREPAAIFWVYGFPLIMAVALGLAFRTKPVETSVNVDVKRGFQAEEIAEALQEDERFQVQIADDQEWQQRLKTGKLDLVVEGIEEKVEPDQVSNSSRERKIPSGVSFRYTFDPTRPGSLLARNAVDDALQAAAGRKDPVEVADQEYSEPGGRYIDFLIPGLIGMSLMGGGFWGVGFLIVDMRIKKLLKRFVATPMKRGHFLSGVMISRLIFIIPEMVLLLIFAYFLFSVTIQGNPLSVLFLILLGAFQFSGIGLLIASRAQTVETVSGLMNLCMLPMWIASGIFFKSDNFPDFMQPVIAILPLTPLIDSLRAVMMEGQSLFNLLPEIGIMGVWTIASFSIALAIFRWK